MVPSELLAHVAGVLEDMGLRYLITGSMASIIYGDARMTNDVDIVVDLPLERVDAFCARFPPENFYVSSDAAREAVRQRSQFNIIETATALKVDIMIPQRTAFDQSRFDRLRRVKPRDDSREYAFSSPEDLIISKLRFYEMGGSEKHLRDIAGIMKMMGDELDTRHIIKWVSMLELDASWQAMQARLAEH